MKTWECSKYGPPEVLVQRETAAPVPKKNEILIKVEARPVTVADCRIRGFRVPPSYRIPARIALGFTKPRKPVLGNYFAGTVEGTGSGMTRFAPGDRVFGGTDRAFGTYGEYISQKESRPIQTIPEGMTFEEAAAAPWGAGTALFFLEQADLEKGMKILINGASGSIGLAAVQLARHSGLTVTAVCSGRNESLVRSCGAHDMIDYEREDFTADPDVYDLILDTVGNHRVDELCRCLKPKGVLLHAIATPDVQRQARRSAGDKGIRFVGGDATVNQRHLDMIKELLEKGELRPMIDSVYPYGQMAEAHARVDSGRKTGDVIVTAASPGRSQ